ncbi:prenyltransferase/squalene oxidase-like repeat protein [Stackebrandtia endophytica]|uniref:Prenyltransferase/squalene oxidase-like repeat protein n=1 Tax=Stackebrandtia endophytica TaxID=1496996 RepID=A0A543AQT0_9ACTN|nr:prenyltransferase/squalene oxidase repeat-containing protein [Stackebrandtia endophytica]TQL74932.1 prenyltransferase/squalene oxidase-like repeat protein [Stackebrandtia endophytica]
MRALGSGARRWSVTAGASIAVLAAAVMLPGVATADEPTAEAVAAADWLAGEIDDAGGMPGMVGTDWGLTIDALIALEATGAAPDVAQRITDGLKLHVRDYNSYDAWGQPGQRVAGATAKLLYAAVITDSDPAAFGEYDLRQETIDLIAGPEAGLEDGRVKDLVAAPSVDNSNTFGQSLAVLGLSRSGGVPQNAVDFLIDQQCSGGGFRLYPYAFGGSVVTGDCDEQGDAAVLDPDSTAMAVQALFTAAALDDVDGAEAAARKGADWLKSIQNGDGSFGGSGPTAAANTNSTGLAGQALAAAGYQVEADSAADWVRKHQLVADTAGAASAELGAIAYNGDSLTEARTNGIAQFQRDQWRRATPQAVLAVAQVSMGEIGIVTPTPHPGGGDDGETSPTPSPTPSTGGTPPPMKQLPVTGNPVLTIAGFGAALVVAGLVTLHIARRKELS